MFFPSLHNTGVSSFWCGRSSNERISFVWTILFIFIATCGNTLMLLLYTDQKCMLFNVEFLKYLLHNIHRIVYPGSTHLMIGFLNVDKFIPVSCWIVHSVKSVLFRIYDQPSNIRIHCDCFYSYNYLCYVNSQ